MPIGGANWIKEGMLGGLRVVEPKRDGPATGFQFTLTNQFFHGSHPLGWMRRLEVEADGTRIASEAVTFILRHQGIPLTQMPEITDIWWHPREVATIAVAHPGGLAPGVHRIACAFEIGTVIFTPIIDWRGRYRTMPGRIEESLTLSDAVAEGRR